MFCPKCKYEFAGDVDVCPDCNVPLVRQVQRPGRAAIAPDDSWVEVCSVPGEFESALIRGALDSNNIPSEIVPGEFAAGSTAAASSSGKLRPKGKNKIVLVPGEFKDDAVVILAAILGNDFEQSERA